LSTVKKNHQITFESKGKNKKIIPIKKFERTVHFAERNSSVVFAELPMAMNHTLKTVRKLENKGFTAPQAECMVEQFVETIQQSDLVTKSFLKSELAELKAEFSREHAELKTEFSREQAEMRTESSRERAEMRTEFLREIAQLEKNLIKWILGGLLSLFGALIGMTGLILGLIYFLHSK
jgi:Skp family chaperone for outer membrane proteins